MSEIFNFQLSFAEPEPDIETSDNNQEDYSAWRKMRRGGYRRVSGRQRRCFRVAGHRRRGFTVQSMSVRAHRRCR